MKAPENRVNIAAKLTIGDQMASDQKEHEFEILFETEGRSVGKMRSEITVSRPGGGETYEMAADEGGFHGGDGTAPPPLAYFATGFTACLMTQIRAFSNRLNIPINGVVVNGTIAGSAARAGENHMLDRQVGSASTLTWIAMR